MMRDNVYRITVGRNFFAPDYTYQSSRNKLKAYQIVEYLQKIHGINAPEYFAEQLYITHIESYTSLLRIPTRTLDSIIYVCELFEEYVVNYDLFVCQQIISLLRIHTCVISEQTLKKDQIKLKCKLPFSIRAIVHKNGGITVTTEHS